MNPDLSDLTWLCVACFDTLYPYRRLAERVNRGGRSGVL